jgi:RNA polymerase sigma-70 factor (ECF subfamily)
MFSFLPSALMSGSLGKTRPPEEVMADYIINRNKKAIMTLYSTFADDMYHYLLTMSDQALAKDIVQKTWLKVIEQPQSYRNAGSLKAWLFTMARNALIDEFRKTNRWVELVNSADGENQDAYSCMKESSLTVSPNQNVDAKNLKTSFDNALMALSFEQREAFCLQQEGFSLADIAMMTHSKQETIKTRLRYAKTKLKELLEQAHD